MPDQRSEGEPFYVGYLPLPMRLRRPLFFIAGLGLWALAIASFFWAIAQNDPGTGAWDDTHAQTLTGRLLAKPFPMIITRASDGSERAVLLVEMGKHGAAARAADLAGHEVEATGYMIHRDGRAILELEPAASSLRSVAAPVDASQPTWGPAEPVVLKGEIVDSKCYLGAMKPGEGKPHKACATLCVRGGIPPMLVTRDTSGALQYYLLTGPDGQPLGDALLPLIAEPVEVAGRAHRFAGIHILESSLAEIRER